MLHISTSVWVMRTPNAGRNGHFLHFLCKKNLKKSKKFEANFSKKQVLFTKHRVAGLPPNIPLMYNLVLKNRFLIKKKSAIQCCLVGLAIRPQNSSWDHFERNVNCKIFFTQVLKLYFYLKQKSVVQKCKNGFLLTVKFWVLSDLVAVLAVFNYFGEYNFALVKYFLPGFLKLPFHSKLKFKFLSESLNHLLPT